LHKRTTNQLQPQMSVKITASLPVDCRMKAQCFVYNVKSVVYFAAH